MEYNVLSMVHIDRFVIKFSWNGPQLVPFKNSSILVQKSKNHVLKLRENL